MKNGNFENFRHNLIQIYTKLHHIKIIGGGGMAMPCAAFCRDMQISKSEKMPNSGYAPVSLPSLEPLSFTFDVIFAAYCPLL